MRVFFMSDDITLVKLEARVDQADLKLENQITLVSNKVQDVSDKVNAIHESVQALDSFIKNLIITLLVAILGLTGSMVGVLFASEAESSDTDKAVASSPFDRLLR